MLRPPYAVEGALVPSACLKWIEPPDRPAVHLLTSAQTLIGRKSDADIILDHPLVSRHHARILREHDGFHLLDLESSHGTYLNGGRVDRKSTRLNSSHSQISYAVFCFKKKK